MPFHTARLLLSTFLLTILCLAVLPQLHAQETPEAMRKAAEQRIEEMVARCQGDKTCEQVVSKRETLAAEKRLQRAQEDFRLKETSPVSYYFALWRRYLAFVFAVCGAAALYIFVMHRLFGKKK